MSCLLGASAPIPACWSMSVPVGVSHGCVLHHFIFETQFYCHGGVDSNSTGGDRCLTMQSHFHLSFGFPFHRKRVFFRGVMPSFLIKPLSAGANAGHMAIQTHHTHTYRWREHMHGKVCRCANMYRYLRSQMEQTEMSSSAACARADPQGSQI